MIKEMKIILDLCGGTGSWSKFYQKDPNYHVIVCTLPDFDVTRWRDDITLYDLLKNVHGILAAPPCTEFSIARNDKTALKKRSFREGMDTVEACLDIIWETRKIQSELYGHSNGDIKLKFWALENPASGYLKHFLGNPPFVFDPSEYGDEHSKKTALWGYFNEPKKGKKVKVKSGDENNYVKSVEKYFDTKKHLIPDGYKEKTGLSMRTIVRSITPQGFAKAFYEANK